MPGAAFHPPCPPLADHSVSDHSGPGDYLRHFRRLGRNPLEVWAEDDFQAERKRFRFLRRDYLILNAPEDLRHVFVTNASNYRMNAVRQAMLRPALRDGLFTAEGEIWRKTRRALAPVFAPRNIGALAPAIHSATERWARRLDEEGAQTVSMSDTTIELGLDVLLATLFSDDPEFDRAGFAEKVTQLLDLAGSPHIFDLLAAPGWMPRIGQAEKMRLIEELRVETAKVAERRRAKGLGEGGGEGRDFLGLLLAAGLPDDAVVDNLLTFLTAGHETTARSLMWTLYLLSQDEEARGRVEREIDQAALIPEHVERWNEQLPYTEAVVKEALRLFPPAAYLPRTAIEADRIGEEEIAAGSQIICSPWLVHRHRKLWREPDAFIPERFLGEEGADIPRLAHIPFGLGPRTCIGARFAMIELVTAVACFTRRMRFALAEPDLPKPVMKITLQPDNPVRMRLERRRRIHRRAA